MLVLGIAIATVAVAVLAVRLGHDRATAPTPAATAPTSESTAALSSPPSASPSLRPSAGPTQKGVRAVSALDYGALAGDGGDDTAALSAALSAAAGKDVAVYLPTGTFDVAMLLVPDGSRLIGDGASRTWLRGSVELGKHCRVSDLKVGQDGRSFRFTDGASRSTLARVMFVGGGGFDSGQDQGVIRFGEGRSAAFITFTDCVIGANSADANGVSIVDQGWAGGTYQHLTWRRCTFKGSPCMDFECIQRSDDVHAFTTGYRAIDLIDCVFEPSGSETVSYDASYSSGYSRVSGCTFLGSGWNDVYPWGQSIEFNRTYGMVFSGNTVYRGRGAMINHNGVPGQRTGTVFRDNVFDATVNRAGVTPERDVQLIYFNNVSGATFAGNLVKSDVGGELAYFSGSSGNTFRGDRFIDARTAGRAFACVRLAGASRNNRFEGEFFQTTAAIGAIIASDGSSGTLVTGSTFVTGGAPPVTADASSGVRLLDNTYR